MSAKITRQMLVDRYACNDQLGLFDNHFPNGFAVVTVKRCKELAHVFDFSWCAESLLKSPIMAEYVAKSAAIWAEYEAKRDTIWAEYEAKRAPIWAEHEVKRATIWAEYVAKRAPILAEHKVKRAELFARLYNKQSREAAA